MQGIGHICTPSLHLRTFEKNDGEFRQTLEKSDFFSPEIKLLLEI